MTECYKFIHDSTQLREFYERILEPHVGRSSRSFILIPIARNKYWSELSKSQVPVSSRTVNTENLTFEHFLNLLRRYEVAEGLYTDKGNPIPAEAFAFYITCDPMDEIEAMFSLVADWNQALKVQLKTYTRAKAKQNKKTETGTGTGTGTGTEDLDPYPSYNGTSKYKSLLHKHPIKSFVKLDVDTLDPDHINCLENFLEKHKVSVRLRVRSKNGYHYLLPKESQSKDLYNYAKESEWFSIENNALIVIPGTYQGGFPTHIVEDR